MGRAIRIQYPGATYHLISRGIEKGEIFYGEDDYVLFKKIFLDVIERYNWECYAYCLMPNHYHLLVKTLDPNLSFGMCQLNGDYSQKFNIMHGRVGHLFQGRYKSILVEEDMYKNKLIRYITLNPLRARLVKRLDAWEWGSHYEIIKGTDKRKVISIEKTLSQFGDIEIEAKRVYLKYLYEKEDCGENFETEVVLGSKLFYDEIRKYFQEQKGKDGISKKERYAFRSELNEIFNNKKNQTKEERNKLISKAHFSFGYSFSEISRELGMHHSSIGKIIKK